ncbi:uncharacterized protein METZ01_LOCUS329372, partial [marine metagenome]
MTKIVAEKVGNRKIFYRRTYVILFKVIICNEDVT